jgi:hypothetical protein
MPLWIAGAVVDGSARVVLWSTALALDYAGPLAGHALPGLGRSHPRDWNLEPSHFVERLELFLIIALGEAIVEAGATASGLPPTLLRLTAVLVAMLMSAALWWLYFDTHAGRTFERLRRAAEERGRLGRDLSYLYVLLVAGIIVSAVGNELVIAHPSRRLDGAESVALAAGPVLYLLGSVVLKVRVLRVPWERRFIAAGLVAVAVALGSPLPGLALWAIVLGILTGLATAEAVETGRGRRPRPPERVGGRARAVKSSGARGVGRQSGSTAGSCSSCSAATAATTASEPSPPAIPIASAPAVTASRADDSRPWPRPHDDGLDSLLARGLISSTGWRAGGAGPPSGLRCDAFAANLHACHRGEKPPASQAIDAIGRRRPEPATTGRPSW